MTKAEQLLKTKDTNPKKLSKAKDLAFRRAINNISTGLCQLCGNMGQDIHHPLYGCYGANRDMTCAMMICREWINVTRISMATSIWKLEE